MTIQELLSNFHQQHIVNDEIITLLQNDNQFRRDLIDHFRQKQDRQFALAFLNKLIAIRKSPDGIMLAEDLMLACYILALHNRVEDVLIIWEAKDIDFDTYCGFDIQLTAFAGVKATIEYLKRQPGRTAERALKYIMDCNEGGAFDDIIEYYSADRYPWFALG